MSNVDRIEILLWVAVVGIYAAVYFVAKTAKILAGFIRQTNDTVNRIDRRTERLEAK